MSKFRSIAKPVAVAALLAATLGGCAVYVPGPAPGYYRGYYAPPPHYYYQYGPWGRPYFRPG